LELKSIKAGVLDVAYVEHGPQTGWPCVMCHGFPYDVQAYAEAAPLLAAKGARVIMPYMRGYGPTKFLSETTLRSGEQAAFGADLVALLDALGFEKAVVAGYDWGGRAACVTSAIWPERVTALVSGNSYNIQNIPRSAEPVAAAEEAAYWYQYYFHSERGRRGLTQDRNDIARHLWTTWSPTWSFSEAEFARSAKSFENEDFVDVVIHSYRHRFGLVPGDPAVAHIETQLTGQPVITVPTIAIDGDVNGVHAPSTDDSKKFSGPFDYRVFEDTGHNLPQERPELWAAAVADAYEMRAS